MTVRNAPPHAESMLESLRGIGYSFEAAIADLIDNSISANASEVRINMHWDGYKSWIKIIDNGDGMDEGSLEKGMRLGALDPRKIRDVNDLGRFGLGLKTASFSQSRRLTVASRKLDKSIVCMRWDLDLIGQESGVEWPLYEGPAVGSEGHIESLKTVSKGTIVLWENLDRIVTDGFIATDMIDLADRLDSHLAMTFHRLLDGQTPLLKIFLNDRQIIAWDPYLIGNPGKALESSEYRIQYAPGVTVQCHVLPHRDMLKPNEQDSAAGHNGWTQHEGFYVYRNKRLLLSGSWLGLGDGGRPWPRDEAHRLARIRIDIPNSMDTEWKINVLKSTASPPVRIRPQLHRLATETRTIAKRVFAHRGHISPATEIQSKGMVEAWQVKRSRQGTSYRINRDHDLVSSILSRAEVLKPDILALLRFLEETVPVQRIWLDTADDKETPLTGFTDAPENEIQDTLYSIFQALVKFRGLTVDEARERLSRTPPFDRYINLVSTLNLKD